MGNGVWGYSFIIKAMNHLDNERIDAYKKLSDWGMGYGRMC